MSLRHVLLVTLSSGPMSGYDVNKKFDSALSHVWQASHQQIYRELNALMREAFVQQEFVQQYDRPSKKLYSITDKGKEELKAWMAQPVKQAPQKHPILAKLFALQFWTEEDRGHELQKLKKSCEDTEATYASIEANWLSKDPDSAKNYGPYQSLLIGRKLNQAWLDWLNELPELKSFADR